MYCVVCKNCQTMVQFPQTVNFEVVKCYKCGCIVSFSGPEKDEEWINVNGEMVNKTALAEFFCYLSMRTEDELTESLKNLYKGEIVNMDSRTR